MSINPKSPWALIATDDGWAQIENEEQRWHEHMAQAAHNTWFEHYYGDLLMKTSEMIQSKFLKKDDFPQPAVLTVRGVSIEEVGRGDTRWVLHFNERTKGIVLNVTKIKQLEAAFGDESDHWVGKKVKVEHDPTVMMGQQIVGGIKFTMPKAGARPVLPTPPPPPAADTDFDDNIPF